jgi:hypothetical protein
MKSYGDLSDIQKQQFFDNSNLPEGNKLNPDNKVRKKNCQKILKKFKKNQNILLW